MNQFYGSNMSQSNAVHTT